MAKETLEKIGAKLGVSGKDIGQIKKNYWKSYFLYIGAAVAVGAIIFVLGCCCCPTHNAVHNVNNGYPYGLVLPGAAVKKKGRIFAGLLGIAAILLLISTPVFGQIPAYGVFSKKR